MNKVTRSILTVTLSAAALLLTVSFVSAAHLAGIGHSVVIAVTPGDSTDPDVAASASITHVVWSESDWIMYSRSTGVTWTAPISVATGSDPALAIDASGVPHLAFTDFFSPTINVYHTHYVGGTWDPPVRVSGGANNTSLPDIAAAPNGSLYMVWSEQIVGTPLIELAQSTNGGASWPSVGPIPNASGNAPKIAVGPDGVIHVIWQDSTAAPYRIKHSERITSTWSLPAILSDATASSFAPDLAATAGKAHVVWQQSSAIKYAHGAKLAWSTPVTISAGSASEPSIAAFGFGALIAAWDSDITITARMGGPAGWGTFQTLGSNAAGIGHVALAAGQKGIVNAVFAIGASPSRDIAYNSFTTGAILLPLIMKN